MKIPLSFYLLLCPIAFSGVAGCHKHNAHIDGVYGQWRWVRTDWMVGSGGKGTVYAPVLTPTILQLNNNGSFSITQNGSTLAQNTFTIDTNCHGGNCDTVATFQNQYAQNAAQSYYWVVGNYILSLQNGNMVLTFDGPFNPGGDLSTEYFVPN